MKQEGGAGGGNYFSTSDFARTRYGRVMQLCVSSVSLFYMFRYLVANMTYISNVYGLLSNNWDLMFTRSIAISAAVFTILCELKIIITFFGDTMFLVIPPLVLVQRCGSETAF